MTQDTTLLPFHSRNEILVAETIKALQERNGTASLKAISDQISGVLPMQEIPRALLLLKEKELVFNEGSQYLITRTGRAALSKVSAAISGGDKNLNGKTPGAIQL